MAPALSAAAAAASPVDNKISKAIERTDLKVDTLI